MAPDEDWEALHGKQPKALHLTLSLTKDHFFQGERIEATLKFTNDDAARPYTLGGGGAGVFPGGFFVAADSKRLAAPNPDRWYFESHTPRIKGGIAEHVLGTFLLTLPVNKSVRFNHPGTYSLYAVSPLIEGGKFSWADDARPVWIVSGKTNITIEPLHAEEEKRTISRTLAGLTTPNGWSDGIGNLGYLGTPKAVDQLISLLGNRQYAK